LINLGIGDLGLPDSDELILASQVKKIITSYVGSNKEFPKLLYSGKVTLQLMPQGSIAAKLQAGGAGIPGTIRGGLV
jgi:acyl CoA:acetate/3-ketoacid CoA transferase alpha subunit